MNKDSFYYILGKDERYSTYEYDLFNYNPLSRIFCLEKSTYDADILSVNLQNIREKVNLLEYKKRNRFGLADYCSLLLQLREAEQQLSQHKLNFKNIILDLRCIFVDAIYVSDRTIKVSDKLKENTLIFYFTYLPLSKVDKRVSVCRKDNLLKLLMDTPEFSNLNFKFLPDYSENFLKSLLEKFDEGEDFQALFEFIQQNKSEIANIFQLKLDFLMEEVGDKEDKKNFTKNVTTSLDTKLRKERTSSEKSFKSSVKKEKFILPANIRKDASKKFSVNFSYIAVCLQVVLLLAFIYKWHVDIYSRNLIVLLHKNGEFKIHLLFLLIFSILDIYLLILNYRGREFSSSKNFKYKNLVAENKEIIKEDKGIYWFSESLDSNFQKSSNKKVEFNTFPFTLSNDLSYADGLFFENLPFYFNLILRRKKGKIYLENNSDYPLEINNKMVEIGERTSLEVGSMLSINQHFFYFGKTVY